MTKRKKRRILLSQLIYIYRYSVYLMGCTNSPDPSCFFWSPSELVMDGLAELLQRLVVGPPRLKKKNNRPKRQDFFWQKLIVYSVSTWAIRTSVIGTRCFLV